MKLSLKMLLKEDVANDHQLLRQILKMVEQINIQFPQSLQKYLGGPISKESFMEPNMLEKIVGKLQHELDVQQDSPIRFQAPSFHNLELLLDRLRHVQFMMQAAEHGHARH